MKGARSLINNSKRAEAEKALTAAEKRWPAAPGLLTERCELQVYAAAYDAARVLCDRALKADPDGSWALYYLSGVIALRDTGAAGSRAGIDKLKRAIDVDPDLGPAWHALGKAYERVKDTAALDALGQGVHREVQAGAAAVIAGRRRGARARDRTGDAADVRQARSRSTRTHVVLGAVISAVGLAMLVACVYIALKFRARSAGWSAVGSGSC